MHDNRRVTEDRLARMLRQRIRPAVYAVHTPLDVKIWRVPGEPVPVGEVLDASFEPFSVGREWGAPWSTSWFRVRGRVPRAWAGRRVEAVIDLGFVGGLAGSQAEALVYTESGVPIKAIAPGNRYVPIARPATGGETVVLLIEAAANPDVLAGGFLPTTLGEKRTAGTTKLYRLHQADLAVLDEEVWHLALDLDVLGELMVELSTADPRRHEILRGIDRALDALDPHDISGTAAPARRHLAEPLSRPASASAHTVCAVGHAHIDSAWLWPVRETIRKVARTFANATTLADEYPEFVFAGPQAQHYAWLKEHHPAVFDRLAKFVHNGQWVPVGGMWVEADGNLPGGEALARQFIHGKRLFAAEFGVDCDGVWLPDSFGYTGAYPQIATLAGMRWFLTQKLSWNQTNTFPHHTFWWEGIDGSRIFTHFPPVDTYTAEITGRELAHAVATYAEKGRGTRSLLPFGHGDGGGGPTREMLERARRLRDMEGSPRVAIGSPVDFFRTARDEYPDAPVWRGELYLERHRATFTTQGRIKAGNRRSEHLLREAELWSATATVHRDVPYPRERLDRIWRAVLLNQFHDILPGSSIAWVHREAENAYAAATAELDRVIAAAMGDAPPSWLYNAGPYARREVVCLPAFDVRAPATNPPGNGQRTRVVDQRLADGRIAVYADVPALGAAPLRPLAPPAHVVATATRLDNQLVRVELDDDGLLTSVRDLVEDREVLPPGSRANLLQLHDDQPNAWDAWDVDEHYRHRFVDLTSAVSVTVVDHGPLLGTVRVERTFGASRIVQTLRLQAGSRRLDIDTEIDWHESEKFLKVAFPLDVHAETSTSEVQFGHVDRPTHTNTSWDAARFETYAHRWVHVGEHGYGVALLTDSTYGHDITRHTRADGGTTTTVRLSLLRAPHSPDPRGDAGHHRLTYALLVGAAIPDAVAEGYALNLPIRLGPPLDGPPLVQVDHPGVVVEAVKLADDESGDVIVRLYEAYGGRARATVHAGFRCRAASTVDLLERPLPGAVPEAADGVLPLADDASRITLRPFQIVTLRLARA